MRFAGNIWLDFTFYWHIFKWLKDEVREIHHAKLDPFQKAKSLSK